MDGKTRELIEERNKAHADASALVDRAEREGRALTDAEQATFDRLQARITELRRTVDNRAQVDAEERALSASRGRKTDTEIVARAWSRPSTTQREPWSFDARSSDSDMALRAWALGSRASRPLLEAAERVGLSPFAPELDVRALSVGTTDAGGYSVPDEMMRAYFEALKYFGPVRELSTVYRTATGAQLPVPTVNDTANVGEIITEGSAVTTTADPTFGQVLLTPYKFSSKAVIVSVELIADSFIDLGRYLGTALGTRIGRIQNTYYTTGTNVGQPNGVATAATLGKTATATNAITFDELVDLAHSVDPAYRGKPGVGFMMHDTTAAYVRKLKDSQNRYQWEISTQLGQPDRLLGYPVYINNDLSSTFSTNNRLVLFGDYSAYVVQEAGPPVFIRADEIRVLNHQVVFLAYHRTDGDLADVTAVKYLRTS